MYVTEAVFENRQTSTLIHLPTVRLHNVLSGPIEIGRFNTHVHITFTFVQHIIVNGGNVSKRGWIHQIF